MGTGSYGTRMRRLIELRSQVETVDGFPEGAQCAANQMTVLPTLASSAAYPFHADEPMRIIKSLLFHS
jgi:hypothetical protein